jgi:hypothetical protein
MTIQRALKSVITIGLAVASLCGPASYAVAKTNHRVQGSKKTISSWRTVLVYPVDIGDFRVNGKSVKADEEFEADADWLGNLTFSLKNKSEKTITFVLVDLTFPETASATGSPVALHQIMLGLWPDSKAVRTPIRFGPGETTEVRLADQYEEIKSLLTLTASSIARVTRIVVRLQEVMFEDGTLWSAGTSYKRNPDSNAPQKWIKVEEQLVTRDRPDDNEPVELGLKVKDRPITFEEDFEEDADWLKNLKLTVTNTSKKSIAYIRVDLIFPETRSTGNPLLHQIFLGRREGR